MRHTKTAWLGWTLCALTVALALAGPILALRAASGTLDLGLLSSSVIGLASISYSLVGALIVSRQPRNTIGWLLLVVGSTFAFSTSVLEPWSRGLPALTTLSPLALALLWLSGWNWWLLVGPLLIIPLLFPSGRLLSPRWHWVVGLLAVSFGAFLFGTTFAPTITLPNATQPVSNPVGFLPDPIARSLYSVFEGTLLAAAAGSGAALFIRYRRAGVVEREQIKWVFYAGALFVVAFILQFVVASNTPQAENRLDIPGLLFAVAIPAVPLSIGIAILRYRLWDIDVIIRRTLIYAFLTGLLALAYFGSVVVLQSTFSALTGRDQSTLVTVLSTLVIAALFIPLRGRVQAVIDRRLYRRKYDAARILAAFSAGLRDETNLDQLTAHLTDVVDETMQPLSVTLWLPAEPDRPTGPGRQA